MKRNLFSRIATVALVFCLAVVGVTGLSFKASADDSNPVGLYYAHTIYYEDGSQGFQGEVSIQNLAYAKNVVIHYTSDGTNWYDLNATYAKQDPNNPGYEIWSFFTYYYGVKHIIFAIKYEVNGQTYWDNNGGSNYYLQPDTYPCVFQKDSIKLTPYPGLSATSLYTKNFGTSGTAYVRYSTDGWNTYQDAALTVKHVYADVTEWNTPSFLSYTQYALYYVANGNTYWDNNYGDNYSQGY